MLVRPSRRLAAAFTTLALGAGLTVAATQASADTTTTPPWESSTPSGGTITFYDSTGKAITSGSTTGPFAAYAAGSVALRAGDSQARLEFANPGTYKTAPQWYRVDGGTSAYPNSSAPSTLSSAAGPVWTGSSSTPSLESLGFDRSTAYTGYSSAVQVRLVSADSANQFTTNYAVADITVDPTTHTWTEIYPVNAGGGTNPGGSDATSISIAATSHVTYGQKGAVTGVLTDTTKKAGVAGQTLTLQQRSSATGAWSTVGSAPTSSTGSASVSISPGTYRQYRWVFAGTTSGTPTYSASTSGTATTTVAQAMSGYVTSASIKSGGNVKFYGVVLPAVKGEKVYLQTLSGKSWVVVKGVVASVAYQKLPNGQVAYGYVLSLNVKRKATYTFRAYAPSTALNTYGISGPHLVKVS